MASKDKKQAKPRRARNSLTRDGILDAAEQVVRSGTELSIREVAAALTCSPMALYRHFPDKQTLLLGLLDQVIGRIPLHDEIQDSRQRLVALATEHLKVLQRNSWAIPLLFQNPDPGPSVRRVGEAMLKSLRESGASKEVAVMSFAAILALNYGWAGFTANAIQMDGVVLKLAPMRNSPRPSADLVVTNELWPQMQTIGDNGQYLEVLARLIDPSP